MYRKRTRQSKRLAAMRAAKERRRLERAAANPRPPPWTPPELRRTITITDHDFGEVTHRVDLRRSDRIDCYDVYADGVLWRRRVGWSRVLEMIRKSFIRVAALDA